MIKTYDYMTAEEYYAAIVEDNEGSAEMAYRLLHWRLYRRLKTIYHRLGGQRLGELDDTLDDFFLYLYEDGEVSDDYGKEINKDGKMNQTVTQEHFTALAAVRCPGSFFSWILRSYRNFLTMSLRNDNVLLLNFEPAEETVTSALTEEEKINHLATALAYMDQTCKTENRFLLYRWLLSFLDKSLAIECEEICKILKTSTVAYRVRTSRQHDKLLTYIDIQDKGGELHLDVPHLIMRDEITDNFDKLYQLLIKYYELAIVQHPKVKEIQALRLQYGFRLHETPSIIVSNPVDILNAILHR